MHGSWAYSSEKDCLKIIVPLVLSCEITLTKLS